MLAENVSNSVPLPVNKIPYWLKYKWELNDTNQDQFVTPFNKTISNDLCNLQFEDKFSVLCKFKIDNKTN